jgi:hypothetical protein
VRHAECGVRYIFIDNDVAHRDFRQCDRRWVDNRCMSDTLVYCCSDSRVALLVFCARELTNLDRSGVLAEGYSGWRV